MGSRRMFSLRIINSGRFLKLPPSTQALYFHLCMRADDDGVVEAYPILQQLGTSELDLKVLQASGFVEILNEDLVTFIHSWNEHNLIRSDRKVDSIYKDLLVKILPEIKLQERRVRADVAKKKTQSISGGQPVDVQWTVNGPPKLSKVKLSKVKEKKINKKKAAEIKDVKKWTLKAFMSNKDYVLRRVQTLYPHKDSVKAIDDFIEACQIKNYNFKDHYKAFCRWVREDIYNAYNLPGSGTSNPKILELENKCLWIAEEIVPDPLIEEYESFLKLQIQVKDISNAHMRNAKLQELGVEKHLKILREANINLIKNQHVE